MHPPPPWGVGPFVGPGEGGGVGAWSRMGRRRRGARGGDKLEWGYTEVLHKTYRTRKLQHSTKLARAAIGYIWDFVVACLSVSIEACWEYFVHLARVVYLHACLCDILSPRSSNHNPLPL